MTKMMPGTLLAPCLLTASLLPQMAQAQGVDASVEKAIDIYECAGALSYGETAAERYRVSSEALWKDFERLENSSSVKSDASDLAVRKRWVRAARGKGPGSMHKHILSVARACEKQYAPKVISDPPVARKPGQYTQADLRYHIQQTGDYAAVADYIVHKYPGGKPLFSELPEGEFLGEFIRKIGAKGVRKFSDSAILGITRQHYWQYNPPATLIISAEYRKRLRARKYSQVQANNWARREQQARTARAQSGVYASPSIGRARTVFQTCTVTTVSGYGGGRVTKCKTYK